AYQRDARGGHRKNVNKAVDRHRGHQADEPEKQKCHEACPQHISYLAIQIFRHSCEQIACQMGNRRPTSLVELVEPREKFWHSDAVVLGTAIAINPSVRTSGTQRSRDYVDWRASSTVPLQSRRSRAHAELFARPTLPEVHVVLIRDA